MKQHPDNIPRFNWGGRLNFFPFAWRYPKTAFWLGIALTALGWYIYKGLGIFGPHLVPILIGGSLIGGGGMRWYLKNLN